MIENRLNGLALLRMHQEIEPMVNEVIQKFWMVLGKYNFYSLD